MGCYIGRTSNGEPLESKLVGQLEPGKMSAKDVTQLLGPPQRVVELDTRSAYEYRFTKQSSAGLWLIVVGFLNEDTRSDRVWVFFDEKGVLTHFGSTFEAHRAHAAMPWRDIHDPEKNAKRDAKWEEQQSKR